MKKNLCLLIGSLALFAAACQPGNNVPGSTAAGAIAGGVLGDVLFHGDGKWAGIAGGALIGGIVGNRIGQAMDRNDRMNMQSAITETPVGSQAEWTNARTQRSYIVRPVKETHAGQRYCREFQTKVKIGDQWQTGYGRACRQPDGAWRIVG